MFFACYANIKCKNKLTLHFDRKKIQEKQNYYINEYII